MNRLDGKVAIVTGATQGQGESHARGIVAEGGRVVLTGTNKAKGDAIVAELGDQARFHPLDVVDEVGWAAAVATAVDWGGGLDILVNNAGILVYGGVEDQRPEDYRRILDINVTGSFLGIQAAVPAMRAGGGGSIINISSVAGLQGFSHATAYTTSKWAVRGLTRSAALDLAGSGIRVNAICPGTIDTALSAGTPDAFFAGLPIPRKGLSSEITSMVVFLASDEAAYCTGAEYLVDGGMAAGASGDQ